ncbi:MAG: PilN domain-containing protein [Deltaproteobacteria bacterium]|jgi:Tfp pilus assembly protein PilN|nr:PilN domain-containing protein [Deltaproteobacteria bacterium]
MIKINLLPLESFKQTATGQMAVGIFAVCVIMLAGALYAFNFMYMSPKKNNLVSQKNTITDKVNVVKAQSTKAMAQTETFVDQLIQIGVILTLEERRRDQTRLFMAMANEVNNQTSWLVNMVHSKNTLTVKGMAIDNPTVSVLLSRLHDQPLLGNVKLQQIVGTNNANGLPLVAFDLTAETTFPPLTVIEQGLPEVELPDAMQLQKLVNAISPDLAKKLEQQQPDAKAL